MTGVLVVDDQELVRAGFRLILERAGMTVVGEAADGVEASRRASTCPSSTRIPSSTYTSVTRPVNFEETVAWRRAVTYPVALRTVVCPCPL